MRIFFCSPKTIWNKRSHQVWYESNTNRNNIWFTPHYCMIYRYQGSSWVLYSGTFRSWVAVAVAPILVDCRLTILDCGLRICVQWLVDPLSAVESVGDFRVHENWKAQCFVPYSAKNELTCISNRNRQWHYHVHRNPHSMVIMLVLDVYYTV